METLLEKARKGRDWQAEVLGGMAGTAQGSLYGAGTITTSTTMSPATYMAASSVSA